MEDKAEIIIGRKEEISNRKSVQTMENSVESLYFSIPDSEPQRKKRCIRFASDYSNEDPLLVSDSGFAELPCSNQFEENGVTDVSSFFSLADSSSTELFEDANQDLCGSVRASSSLDTLSLTTDLSDLPDPEEESAIAQEAGAGQLMKRSNSSSSSNSSSYGPSEAGSSHNSSRSSEQESDTDTGDLLTEKTLEQIIFNCSEISGHPGRIELMKRFLSQFKGNPDDAQLQRLLNMLLSSREFSPPRLRLRHVTSMVDVVRLLRCSRRVLVLTGAGISVSCGIPDFRSKDGLYARVSKVHPQLRDPQSVFDIRLFRRDPRPFFLTAKELYPGQFEPSLSHKFIRKLEMRGQLLRNYSQNIDTLEKIAGIDRVTMCHGSFATATCLRCRNTVNAEEIKDKVLAGDIPYCRKCSTPGETDALKYPLTHPSEDSVANDTSAQPGRRPSFDDDDEDYYPSADILPLPPILKPDIVFFGEDLPDEFHHNLEVDKPVCDLLLVIGSSLRVRPVSLIPGMLPSHVPQILINRESLPHCTFDIELLGNCDTIISELCHSLGNDFTDLAMTPKLSELDKLPRTNPAGEAQSSQDPQSEDDIQALKACWEPKVNENIAARLPENSYLCWKPRQYVFEGAEVDYDPDDDDEDDSSSDSSSTTGSDSSELSSENVELTLQTDISSKETSRSEQSVVEISEEISSGVTINYPVVHGEKSD